MSEVWDVIVSGAGLSGVLTASRIHQAKPEWRILIVDKNPMPGGRIVTTEPHNNRWGYGMNNLGDNLYEFIGQAKKVDPEASELTEHIKSIRGRGGILAAGKITPLNIEDSFKPTAGRAFAGAIGEKDWKHVEKVSTFLGDEKKGATAFGTVWPGTRKSPSAIVMEHIGRAAGIADIWAASTNAVIERIGAFAKPAHHGQWEPILEELLEVSSEESTLHLNNSCRILGAKYENETWQLDSEQGPLFAKKLVVAQDPWSAQDWLPKKLWPQKVLQVPSKTKPISAVTISEKIKHCEGLPELLFIPAESVQVFSGEKEICYQVTLPFEFTLQAPAVVKAVKRLKRARRKVMSIFPDLSPSQDRLALLPVAWPQPVTPSDRRIVEKLDNQQFQQKHLAFCGDSYGGNFDGDQNIIDSVISASETFIQEK